MPTIDGMCPVEGFIYGDFGNKHQRPVEEPEKKDEKKEDKDAHD